MYLITSVFSDIPLAPPFAVHTYSRPPRVTFVIFHIALAPGPSCREPRVRAYVNFFIFLSPSDSVYQAPFAHVLAEVFHMAGFSLACLASLAYCAWSESSGIASNNAEP